MASSSRRCHSGRRGQRAEDEEHAGTDVLAPEGRVVLRFVGLPPWWPRPAPGTVDIVAPSILVVDDNEQFRGAVTELLTLRGFRVVGEAADGDEAVAAVDRGCPDAVLMDINMPGHDGYAVSELLVARCPASRIVLTSSETVHVAQEVLEDCGATAFVPKTELADRDLWSLFWRPEDHVPDR